MDTHNNKFFNRSVVNRNIFYNSVDKNRSAYVEVDLSDIRVLHAGVDTFKQLFRGVCNCGSLAAIDVHYSNNPDIPIVLGDYEFKVSKSASVSGFQWLLKNLNLGVVVLFKSFYEESDQEGTHLKIEFSPNRLLSSDPIEIDQLSINIASMLLDEFTFSDVAVHIACDFKGYSIPDNLEKRLKTRAKRNFAFSGLDVVEFDINSAVARYGSNESYTFGSPTSIQMCLYDKSKEAGKRDKLDFWINHWSTTPSVEDPFESEYKNDDKVTRLEARFHHSVVKQFVKGTGKMGEVNSFCTLCPHLTGLFRYFLDNFRLHHSKNFIDPLWQMLMEDVEVYGPCRPLYYKRSYKSESSTSRRNVAFWIGNSLRLFARQGFEVDFVVRYYLESGLISDLKDYLKLPPNATTEEVSMVLRDFVDKRLKDHLLNGVAV